MSLIDIVLIRFMNERAGNGKAYIPTECEHIANICTHAVCLSLCMSVSVCLCVSSVVTGYTLRSQKVHILNY